MLIRQDVLERIAAGEVTLAFRRWRRPTVKAGGTLRTAVGVLAIEAVDEVNEDIVSAADARAAGHASPADLKAALGTQREGVLYRIRLRLAGNDPRRALGLDTQMDQEDIAQLQARLARLDARAAAGPWTLAVLEALAAQPGLRAAVLAQQLGVEKEWLKVQMRKLKELGLTQSLKTGYCLSPRGEAALRRLR